MWDKEDFEFNICLDCFWFYYYHHYEQNTRKVNRFLKVNCYPRCINFVVTMVTGLACFIYKEQAH